MSKHSLYPELSGFIHNLRASLPYLEEFDQQTFVIYLSGGLIEVQNSRLIEDLALLQQVGIRIVFVHGAELQIRNLYASQGLDYHTDDGFFFAEEKIYRLLNRQSLLPTGSYCQGSGAVLTNCKLLPDISYWLRKKFFQTIMIPTLPEVFAVLTLKLKDRLLLTRNI